MPDRILRSMEAQTKERLTTYEWLAASEPGLRADVQDAQRRLQVIAQMRTLYVDLRAAKQRVSADLRAYK